MAVGWSIVSMVLLAWALAALDIDRSPTAAAGRANLAALVPFWGASASGWGALTLLWWTLRRVRVESGRRFARVAALIVAVAAGARAAILITAEPRLSDDVYRYVFDGRNGAAGVNPYLTTPQQRRSAPPSGLSPLAGLAGDSAAERWAGESLVVELVNNPELHTIYLPASQWLFRAVAWTIPDGVGDPQTAARMFRLSFVLVEMAVIVLILVALRMLRRSAWWAALYAWHPLALTEIAASGHQDVLGMALLVAGLVLYTSRPTRVAQWIWTLALAVLVKPIALPAAALLLRGRSWRAWLAALAVGLVVAAVVAVPLLAADDGAAWENLRATAARFSLKWAHFGSVYEPLLTTIERFTPAWTNDGQERFARGICVGVLGIVVLGVFLRGRDAWADCATIFLAMVLLSPTAHPWYLLWALAVVPAAPKAAVWAASLTLPWGYAVLADTKEWTVPAWVMIVAYAPIYALLVAPLLAPSRYAARHART